MRQKQIWKRRLFGLLVASFVVLSVAGICLTSCQLKNQEAEGSGMQSNPSANEDVFESKVVYYEAQVQTLAAQLNAMEQQIYAMQETYLNWLEQLEERLSNNKAPEDEMVDTMAPPSQEDVNASDESLQPDADASKDSDEEITLSEYTYRLDKNFAILTSYRGNATEVVVPAAVDGHLVIGLDDKTFAGTNVISVVLPDTVERLGWFTFYQCDALEKVVLPAGLSVIGYASFDGCPASLCLYVKPGSYAEQFANSFGIRCEAQA